MKMEQTREELREMARMLNVPRGRNTKDTIANLAASGKVEIISRLVIKKAFN